MWFLEFGSLHGPKESMQVYVYRLEAGFHVTALGPKYIHMTLGAAGSDDFRMLKEVKEFKGFEEVGTAY